VSAGENLGIPSSRKLNFQYLVVLGHYYRLPSQLTHQL
jgi:hypothetical protein